MKDDLFPNGSIDRWLRQHADDPDASPAPDGWDTPSAQVWEQVRAGIRARKKRRRLVWFWWLLLGVCGVGAGGALWKSKAQWQDACRQQVRETTKVSDPPDMEAAPLKPTASAKEVYCRKPVLEDKPFIYNRKKVVEPPIVRVLQMPDVPSMASREALPLPLPPLGHAAEDTKVQAELPAFFFPLFSPVPQKDMPLFQPHKTLNDISLPPPKLHRNPDFYIGLHTAALYTTRTLRPETANARPNGMESGAWTWQTGLEAGLHVNRHWSVETGLQLASVRIDAQRRGAFRFRTDQERYNAQRQRYESTARQGVQTSFGEVEMRFDMSRTAAQPIPDQALVYYALQTREQVGYLRIPLLVRYRAGRSRWQWGFAAGAGLNIRNGYAMVVAAARTDRPGIREISVQAERSARGLANAMADVQGELRIGYRFSPRWMVKIGPEGRYGLGSMYRDGPFRSYPVSFGGQLGLEWRL